MSIKYSSSNKRKSSSKLKTNDHTNTITKYKKKAYDIMKKIKQIISKYSPSIRNIARAYILFKLFGVYDNIMFNRRARQINQIQQLNQVIQQIQPQINNLQQIAQFHPQLLNRNIYPSPPPSPRL